MKDKKKLKKIAKKIYELELKYQKGSALEPDIEKEMSEAIEELSLEELFYVTNCIEKKFDKKQNF